MAEEKSTKSSLAALRESAIEVVKGLADTFEDGLDTFAVRNAILPSREERPSRFIGAIDQGTTSTRFIIFDLQGSIAASHQTELGRVHDQPGWHEQDPAEVVSSVQKCIEQATKTLSTMVMKSVRLKYSDLPTNEKLQSFGIGRPEICGLPISTYSSSAKLVWLLRNVPEVKAAYDAGNLAFGTVDTWLLYNLNGGKEKNVFVTDVSNASRTMFTNLHTLKYDDKLLNFFGLDQSKLRLPKIVPSADPTAFGQLATGVLKGVRIMSCLGDQSAALVGHEAFEPGMAKNTYGTGCFLLYNVGEKPVISSHGLLATVGYQLGANSKPVYALEGSIAVAGSGVNFLMNNLGFFRDARRVDDEASSVQDNDGCVFVTAFSGLFAPYWIDTAKGTIFGITQHTKKGHIARATLEAVCFQTKAVLDAMERDSGQKLAELRVDGGLSTSNVCMQSQADIIRIPVKRPAMHEVTALGAAIAAGIAIKIWEGPQNLEGLKQSDKTVFEPKLPEEESNRIYKKWSKAVEMSRGWMDSSD
ncbi:glycerol kinase [Trichophyton equinum CBS 127.97]|uniref:glycerol kinase n=1 Tax=Trichophyton equinum (strain ATCC MYA-4606 / CBS 127.97) TaxID=559882 RepID=F2Q5E2_TRIEC|nr:glycerol kinase [Trichophyton equinum CBS 127.97]